MARLFDLSPLIFDLASYKAIKKYRLIFFKAELNVTVSGLTARTASPGLYVPVRSTSDSQSASRHISKKVPPTSYLSGHVPRLDRKPWGCQGIKLPRFLESSTLSLSFPPPKPKILMIMSFTRTTFVFVLAVFFLIPFAFALPGPKPTPVRARGSKQSSVWISYPCTAHYFENLCA
jgi:hypothetical protein